MVTSRLLVPAIAAALCAAAANAELIPGAPLSVSGTAGPEFGGTTWGTSAGQGVHLLGGSNTYWDATFGNPVLLTVGVSSTINNPYSATFYFNFGDFQPSDFTQLTIDIVGLKSDGSIDGVASSQGVAITDGNAVHWSGFGGEVSEGGILWITVSQVPAPGALALLGVAGLVGGRRRRAHS
jgi:MYXO-CTERM domain-containing protein